MGYVYSDNRSGRRIYCVAFNDVDGSWIRRREPGATKASAHRILETEEKAVLRAKEKGFTSLDTLKAHESKNASLSFEDFSKDYLSNIKSEVKESTYERYADIMEKHLVPAFGSESLASIDAERIEKYRDSQLDPDGRGAAKGTVCQEVSILSGLFTLALKRKKIAVHPIKGGMVKKPKLDKRTPRYLTAEEKSALLARVDEPLKSAILISMNTGFRESELSSLTWADVDSDQRTITIRERKSGVPLVVPYNDTVSEVLRALPRYLKSPYVITNPRTQTRYDRFNNSAWKKAVKDAGLKLRWHDLRSHCGSTLAQAGRSSKEIQALLGQSSLASTEKYLALAPENLKAAVRSLDTKTSPGAEVTTQITTQKRVAK